MMSMRPSIKIVKFMTPGSGVQALGWGQYGHKVKKILKNLLLYSHTCEQKTEYMVMMSMRASTKIVKFMTPLLGVQALGWGQYGHIVKMF